jgi:predicted nucleic acid-binding protein
LIFIDTAAFLARYLRRDQHHVSAQRAWQKLDAEQVRLLTSNFVLDECFTLLARRTTHEYAAGRARAAMASQRLEILRPDEENEIAAIDLFEKFSDQKVSFTDCISFALLRSRNIHRVFTYDRHFALAGFEVWPGPVATS